MKSNQVYDIPLSEIDISDLNVRHHDAKKDLEELKASITRHGLLLPVTLLGEPGRPRYRLISGQRRFLAHEELGLKTIRAVFEDDLDNTQIIIRSLAENLHRLDLDYIDAAKAITDLYHTYGNDDRRVAQETGLSLRRVRDYISLEALATDKMKGLVAAGKVSPNDVKRALRASSGNNAKAEELLELMAEFRPTNNQKKRIVFYGEKSATASARELLEKAYEPHIEETIIVALPEDLKAGVTSAMKAMNLEAEEFAIRAIREWLHEKGFINQSQ